MTLKQFSVTNEHCALCWRTDPSFLEVLEVALAGSRISATASTRNSTLTRQKGRVSAIYAGVSSGELACSQRGHVCAGFCTS